ncbi:MAG: hypothetical protein ACOX7U_07845 [Desulfitobacteriia bacterium]
MSKFVTVKRKHLAYSALALAIVVLGYFGISYMGEKELNVNTEQVQPEMKIISIEFDPQIMISDRSYGEEEYKGIKIMPQANFKTSAIIQNMTEQTVKDVPVILSLVSLADKNQKVSKEGKIPLLEPGATAKITFENISALGDAKGESALAGQHELILEIRADGSNNLQQNTEARVLFNVDTAAVK